MFRYGKRRPAAALLLSIILVFLAVCPINVKAAGNDTVRISTAGEFLEFARNCTSEDYSRGRRFVLEQDISLDEAMFTPAAVFAGEFDGNGHMISGISFHAAGSNQGLFRYVEADGIVRNLHAEGEISPNGSRINIGGITGVNRGVIKDCIFSGKIMADEAVGGIAGLNEAEGRIEGCENRAEITGNRLVGGITGKNEGLILDCQNKADVNTSKSGVIEDDKDEYAFDQDSLQKSLRIEKINDVGGVSGWSTGTIQGCSNYGAVGIVHTGYNIGGIAGRQNGLISGCSNFGPVTGRKDVGGVAGHFEPYLEISYHQDAFDQLQDQFDTLSGIGDDMSDRIRSTTDTASANLDQAKDILGEIKAYSRQQKDLHRQERDLFDDKAGKQLDQIQDILDAVEIDFGSSSARRALGRLRSNINKAKDLLGQMDSGSDDDIIDDDDITGGISGDLEDAWQTLVELAACADAIVEDTEILIVDGFGGVEDGLFDLKDDLDSLRTATRSLSDLTRTRKDDLYVNLDAFDESITGMMDRLYDQMDVLSDDLKTGKSQVRNETDRLDDQLGSMRQVVTDGSDRLEDKADKLTDDQESLYDDISDDENRMMEYGSIVGCSNQGSIAADYQAGGIAGMIGIEVSLDPEADIESIGDRSMNADRYARASIWNSRNEGDVTAEYACAGGIAGKAAIGALIGNQNYGNARVDDGDYAGGIAGSSKSLIRGNFSMSQISGGSYLGGIAGWGTDLQQNYAMVSLHCDDGEWIGSIAGAADADGEISGNYYVDEWVGAVDGITRTGEAIGLGYDAFIQLDHVPTEFSELTVTFLADNQVVKTIPCVYNQSLPAEEIPAAPMKNGYYYTWEETDLSAVRGNLRIHAVYHPWTTTIASSDEPKPLLLAEANFHPDTRLIIAESIGDGWEVPKQWRAAGGYLCEITEQEQPSEMIVFRVLAADYSDQAVVGIVSDGQIRLTDTRRDGDYLTFQMPAPGQFFILEPQSRIIWYVIPLVAVLLLAGMGIWQQRRRINS